LIENNLSFFAELLNIIENPKTGMWILYGIIVVLTIIAYKLGFSRKLPILKSMIVYMFLIFGCTILTFFATMMPIVEGLIVINLVLIIYRVRRFLEGKREVKTEQLK